MSEHNSGVKIRYIAFWALLVGIVAVGIILHQVGFSEIMTLLRGASMTFIVCYLITSLLIAIMLTLKWGLVLHSQGHHVPHHRLFAYRLVGYSVSYLTPTAHVGGEPIRAYLLKRENIPVNTAFSTVVIDKSVDLMVNVAFFFVGALVVISSVNIANNMKIVLVSLALGLVLLAWMFFVGVFSKQSMFVAIFRFFRLHKIKRLQSIEKNLAQVEKQLEQFYKTKKDYFLVMICFIIILWTLMFLEYRFALLIFGHMATPIQVFLILTGVGLAYAVPIPAAMGSLELGQISAAKVLDLSSATGIALAFLVRTRDLIWTALGLIFLSIYQFNFLRLTKQSTDIDKEFERGNLFKRRS
jgi:glycosyltransferase 2 family protein